MMTHHNLNAAELAEFHNDMSEIYKDDFEMNVMMQESDYAG